MTHFRRDSSLAEPPVAEPIKKRKIKNTMRMRWLRHKCQAKYRKEVYDLPYDSWLMVWQDSGKQDKMGRRKGAYTMVRIDPKLPWHITNVAIMERRWHTKMNLPNQRRYAKFGYSEGEYVIKPVNSVDKEQTNNDSHTEITIQRESDHKR